MTAKILMLGWGFPPNASGGFDTYVGEMFERLKDRDGVDIEPVLSTEYAPNREGIVGVSTGRGDIITRIGRLGSTLAERAAKADIVHTHDWFGYGPRPCAKSNNEGVE